MNSVWKEETNKQQQQKEPAREDVSILIEHIFGDKSVCELSQYDIIHAHISIHADWDTPASKRLDMLIHE